MAVAVAVQTAAVVTGVLVGAREKAKEAAERETEAEAMAKEAAETERVATAEDSRGAQQAAPMAAGAACIQGPRRTSGPRAARCCRHSMTARPDV